MMSQNSKPLITIVGALSKQGRSVAHALLQSGHYRVDDFLEALVAGPAYGKHERG